MLLPRSTDIYPKELARDMRELFNSLLGFRYLPHRGTLLKRLSAAARFRFRNDVLGSGKRFRKKPMILPHGFRRLRLAECSVKPRQATPNSVASSPGASSSHPARGGKESSFTCSDRAVLQRKLEQLAEGGHGGAETHRGFPSGRASGPGGFRLELSLNGDCSELKDIGQWIPELIPPHRRDALFNRREKRHVYLG